MDLLSVGIEKAVPIYVSNLQRTLFLKMQCLGMLLHMLNCSYREQKL